jgi:Ca-activated chloride channel family protein
MKFLDLPMLLLLWVLPALLGLLFYAGHRRRQGLARFVAAGLQPLLTGSVSPERRGWKAALLLMAFAMAVLAAARPAWNPVETVVQRQGRDVVFVLDVSRSMLAEDLAPNRLERAKLAIRDCVERLEGDRVGLVVFAGTAVVKCPLTLDYGFFRLALEDVSVESVSRGGTLIGDALRKTLDEVFDDQQKKYKDIILITDGEDHDSFPVQAAEDAGNRGIRLLVVGIGDEEQGSRIPITDEQGKRSFMKYQGREVWSKLDGDTLRKMVNATPGGRYLNVATGTIDLGDVYQKLVASAEKRELESRTVKRYEEKFQVFAALALLLLCIEMTISERKGER